MKKADTVDKSAPAIEEGTSVKKNTHGDLFTEIKKKGEAPSEVNKLKVAADALDGGPQQTLCEMSVVRLMSFTEGSANESQHCQGHKRHRCDMNQPRFDT